MHDERDTRQSYKVRSKTLCKYTYLQARMYVCLQKLLHTYNRKELLTT